MTMFSSVNFGCQNGIIGTPKTPKTTGEVLKDWVDSSEKERIDDLKQKEQKGTISSGEQTYLNLTRALDCLGGILKPTVVFLGEGKKIVPSLTNGVLDIVVPKNQKSEQTESFEEVQKSQVSYSAEDVLGSKSKVMADYGKLCYEFETMKEIVSKKRKDGTITEDEEGRLNVVAMTWLIETSKIKKVLGKELKKRVDKGLDPEIAQKIANFSPAAMKAFLKTDNKGNYLIPTCALNKMNSYGGFEIKEEKSRIFNEGDVEAEISYVKNPKGKYGSCIFGSIKYTSGTICRTHDEIVNNKGVPYNTVEIRDDFNSILQISTAKNLEPLDEAVYSYRVIGNLINLDPIKQGKLSELQ